MRALAARQVIPVSQINRYVKKLLDGDVLLAGLFVKGEISNYRPHSSGHMYFTLKDKDALLSAVMFSSHAENLDFEAKNGMEVICFGRISLYEKTGQYQMYAEFLEPAGAGALQLAFNKLKEKLMAEGLFDVERKKPVPSFAETIAIITSPTSAAVQDILRVAGSRNRAIKLVVVPSSVQGQGAAEELAQAIATVNEWGKADVIILGRGGGSEEDLWAFNEEVLARAIAKSKIPIISAVGHETDFTISDFVADLRAPTPTAAAQMATYAQADAITHLSAMYKKIGEITAKKICLCYNQIKSTLAGLNKIVELRLKNEWQNLAYLESLLEKVSPQAVFSRGFSMVTDEKGKAVTSIKDLSVNQSLNLTMADGKAKVQVESIMQEGT